MDLASVTKWGAQPSAWLFLDAEWVLALQLTLDCAAKWAAVCMYIFTVNQDSWRMRQLFHHPRVGQDRGSAVAK